MTDGKGRGGSGVVESGAGKRERPIGTDLLAGVGLDPRDAGQELHQAQRALRRELLFRVRARVCACVDCSWVLGKGGRRVSHAIFILSLLSPPIPHQACPGAHGSALASHLDEGADGVGVVEHGVRDEGIVGVDGRLFVVSFTPRACGEKV